MERPVINFMLYFYAATANILGLSSGIAYAWSSPVIPKLKENPNFLITSSEEAWIVGILSLGAIFGPVFAGTLADKMGRKKALLTLAFPITLAYFMMAFSTKILIFYIARFMMGLGIGSIYTILPMYLTEIAETHNRGTIGCLMGVSISSGFLYSYAIGPYLTVQYFCLLCAFPLLVFMPVFSLCNPESPQYLAMINDQKNLYKNLRKIRNRIDSEINVEMQELNIIIQQLKQNENKNKFKELFGFKSLRKALVISLGLILLQQFAGINAVRSYMQTIFSETENNLSPEVSTIVIGIIQVFATICTSSLADKLGRKILLLISAIGSGLSLAILGVYFSFLDSEFQSSIIFWIPIITLITFIIFFNLGLASVPWTVMAELFPPHVKSLASTLTTVVCFFGTFLITFWFPSLVEFFGMGISFWIFAGVCGFGCAFIFFKVPETKGNSLQEIQNLLER